MEKLIAENLGCDIGGLADHESQYSHGETGELRIYLQRPLYHDEIEEIRKELDMTGMFQEICQDARILLIRFRKASSPLLAIIAVLALISSAILGWQLFKGDTMDVPAWLVIGVAGAAMLILSRRRKVK